MDREHTKYPKGSLQDDKTPDTVCREHTKHAEGSSKGNPKPDNVETDNTKPAEGPSDDNPTQDTVGRENTKQTKIPQTLVEQGTPKVVLDVVDGNEQESWQTKAKTGETSPQETTSFSLGNDLGLCVRSLSDMNIVVKRLTTGKYKKFSSVTE